MWAPTEPASSALHFSVWSPGRGKRKKVRREDDKAIWWPYLWVSTLLLLCPLLVKQSTIHDPCSPICFFSSILFACLNRRRSCQRLVQNT